MRAMSAAACLRLRSAATCLLPRRQRRCWPPSGPWQVRRWVRIAVLHASCSCLGLCLLTVPGPPPCRPRRLPADRQELHRCAGFNRSKYHPLLHQHHHQHRHHQSSTICTNTHLLQATGCSSASPQSRPSRRATRWAQAWPGAASSGRATVGRHWVAACLVCQASEERQCPAQLPRRPARRWRWWWWLRTVPLTRPAWQGGGAWRAPASSTRRAHMAGGDATPNGEAESACPPVQRPGLS